MFLIKDFTIKKTKERGQGAFASSDIEAGTVIGDYLGTILPEEQDDQSRGVYSMAWGGDDDTIILANPDEIGIHLINYSCAPNCGMYPYNGRTLYFALRKIFKGEELTVNYFLGEPDETCNPCPDACYCGEPSCRGTMHTHPATMEVYLQYEKNIQKKQHIPKRPQEGITLKKLKKYPGYVEAPYITQLSEILALKP